MLGNWAVPEKEARSCAGMVVASRATHCPRKQVIFFKGCFSVPLTGGHCTVKKKDDVASQIPYEMVAAKVCLQITH